MIGFDGIETMLRARIGLDLESIGRQSLVVAIETRARALAIDTALYESYLDDASEVQSLINELVVPETWFFRDATPFSHLGPFVRERAERLQRPVRVLSAPCSSGEEAYSAAMALVDAGVDLSSFRVDAVDVAPRLVEHARRGVYGKNSFRGADLSFRERYFTQVGSDWTISASLRSVVQFRAGNLLDGATWLALGEYDAILCRNLFIYLTREARVTLAGHLMHHLSQGGTIYVGHAELLESIDARFRALPERKTFGYGLAPRPGAAASASAPAPPARPRPAPPKKRRSSGRHARGPILPPPAAPPPAPPSAPVVTLAQASELADRGQLAEAIAACERYLRGAGPDAAGFELLGVLRSAQGDDSEAARCFERALYLDPRRYDALVHLALLCERRGDAAGAANLRRRADRVHAGRAEGGK